MNRFEQIEGVWYWRLANGELSRERDFRDHRMWDELLEDPLFLEFIRPETEQFAQYLFALHFCDHHIPGEARVVYKNPFTHAMFIEVRINMRTGEKNIVCETYSERDWKPLAECMQYYSSEFKEWAAIKDMRGRFAALEVENAKMTAELAALRAENTELKYRPGGPGYEEAEAHFTALAN